MMAKIYIRLINFQICILAGLVDNWRYGCCGLCDYPEFTWRFFS